MTDCLHVAQDRQCGTCGHLRRQRVEAVALQHAGDSHAEQVQRQLPQESGCSRAYVQGPLLSCSLTCTLPSAPGAEMWAHASAAPASAKRAWGQLQQLLRTHASILLRCKDTSTKAGAMNGAERSGAPSVDES